jgi:hypothetical protein
MEQIEEEESALSSVAHYKTDNRLHELDQGLLHPSFSNTVHKEYKFINYYPLCNTAQ